MNYFLTSCFFLFFCSTASSSPSDLLDTARLWRDVKYAHPALVNNKVDWDLSLTRALPKIVAARNEKDLKSGLADLMQPLSDSELRISAKQENDIDLIHRVGDFPIIEWISPTTALINLNMGRLPEKSSFEKALVSLEKSDRIIIDIRAVSFSEFDISNFLMKLLENTISSAVDLPSEQYRFSGGTRPLIDNDEPGLYGGVIALDSLRINPGPFSRKRKIAFIVNEIGTIPKAVIAMQRQGNAVVVGEFGDKHPRIGPLSVTYVGGIRIEYSSGRLIDQNGGVSFKPDIILAKNREAGPSSVVVQTAIKALNGKKIGHSMRSVNSLFPIRSRSVEHDASRFPSLEIRQLAAIKLWAIIDRQGPTREHLGALWDDALLECLDEMETVKSELDYGLALQKMAAKINDSHVRVWSAALNQYWGQAEPGVQLDFIENKVIVIGLNGAAQPVHSLVKKGDEIIAVDGISVAARLEMILPQISGATDSRRTYDAVGKLLFGPASTILRLTVLGPDGRREVELERKLEPSTSNSLLERKIAVQSLPGKFAYVDLAHLEKEDVAAMFASIDGTSGVIFDIRGYPLNTAWSIAPRLNVNGIQAGPNIQQTFLTSYSGVGQLKIGYSQNIKFTDMPIYRGKVVVLIDERTISQGEHTALMFEAAAPVTFIGSPSAGTNGDLRHIVLPGRVTISFSGYEVRHADGRQLQYIGIQPDIFIKPTIQGIRLGRDETLERAVRFLQSGK